MNAITAEMCEWIEVITRPRPGSPAIFLDRDGTVIENCDYLASPAEVTPIPGAAKAIEAFRDAGYAVVMVTNQSGVARGLIQPKQYAAVNRRMHECLGNGLVDAVFACPFHPDGLPPYRAAHRWRKPEPGMLLDAAELFELDLARSIMVGDSLSDILAGKAAGVARLVHVATGHGQSERGSVIALNDKMSGKLEVIAGIGDLKLKEGRA